MGCIAPGKKLHLICICNYKMFVYMCLLIYTPQVRYLLQNGARPSINQPGNSALACVLRHVRDWEFRYELLNMLLQEGGNPNFVGRDGSVPLMVCLVPLINKDPLHHFTHNMKVCKITSSLHYYCMFTHTALGEIFNTLICFLMSNYLNLFFC